MQAFLSTQAHFCKLAKNIKMRNYLGKSFVCLQDADLFLEDRIIRTSFRSIGLLFANYGKKKDHLVAVFP